jgi:hypothetical protein
MNRQGIDMQAVVYWMPAADALAYARRLNGRLGEPVVKDPQRFVALASVPMQDGARSPLENWSAP